MTSSSAGGRFRAAHTEPSLAAVVSNARSSAEVQFATTALKETAGEREILELANLREALLEIPETPFGTGGEIAILERTLDYERTGRSYRCEFLSSTGFYGLEFCGDGNLVESIVVHAPGVRIDVSDHDADEVVSSAMLDLIFAHDTLLDALVQALRALGVPFGPRFHMGLEEFMLEHAVESIEDLRAIF